MNYRKAFVPFLIVVSVFLAFVSVTRARESSGDIMVLDNTEPVEAFGLDSTGSWWALTKAFSQFVNVYIDGERYGPYTSADKPRFAQDGSSWAFTFVRDLQAYIRTPEGERSVAAETVNNIVFASQNPVPWIEYSVQETRTITDGTRVFTTTGVLGTGKLDPTGTVMWNTAQRGSQMSLVRNGVDKYVYDALILAGVWMDTRPVYAAQTGSTWSVFIGDQEILTNLQTVVDLTVNVFGSVLSFSAARSNAPVNAYLYTDDYRNPWVGPNLEAVSSLVLSPCCDLIAVTGKLQGGARMVSFNSASYPAGTVSSLPAFSFDGEHMAFLGDDGEGFVSMDGRRHTVKGGGVATYSKVAVSPSGRSVAWVSGSTLVVYDIIAERMALGKMCDTMGPDVIYNRRTSEYQALGLFGGRLFLLSTPTS